MIMGLWIAIIGVLLAMLIETLVFRKRREDLKAKQQCFHFHDLRDRLQLLEVDHQLEPRSRVRDFLWTMINVSIRNAGVMKMSDVLALSRQVKKQADRSEIDSLQTEILSCPKDVQELASDVTRSFASMLVTNDDVTTLLFKGLQWLTTVANDAVIRCAKLVVNKIVPKRVQVIREANDFDRLGQRLARSY